jgi:hypothetical protein
MALEDIKIPTPQEIGQDNFTTARELLIICTMLKAHVERQQAQIDVLTRASSRGGDHDTRLAKLESMAFPPAPEGKRPEAKGKSNAAD